MSFFRYPGGKSKLRKVILDQLYKVQNDNDLEYREPFFGGGSIGLNYLGNVSSIWINDRDIGVASLWTSVIKYHDKLKDKVVEFKPSINAFDDYKEELLNTITSPTSFDNIVDIGFKKMAIHQISYSGLGVMSGGPLGGREQKSQYKIDCRWSPNYIVKKIDKLHSAFKNVVIRYNECTCLDFEDVVNDNVTSSLIYLDPPYYVKGSVLYQYGFSNNDHIRLSNVLKSTNHKWVLSYDNADEIINLYNWANASTIDVNYSITALKEEDGERKSRQKQELLITQ